MLSSELAPTNKQYFISKFLNAGTFFIITGILLSCIHINYFYYSYDTPKWFIYELSTFSFISYFLIRNKIIEFQYNFLGKAFIFLLIYMTISISWSANKAAAIGFSLHFLNCLLFITILIKAYNSKQLLQIMLNTSFYSALFFSLLFYFDRYVLGHTNYNVGNYSPIGFMNNAGAVFNVWIPALILYAINQYKERNIAMLFISILTILMIVSVLMEAATRGTILGLSIFELIVFVISFRKNKKHAFIYLAITTLLMCGIVVYKFSDALQSGRLEGKILALSNNIADSSGKRIQLFKNTWTMTLDNPFGVGINNFEYIHPKYGHPGTNQASPYINERQILTTPHNLILKLYSELGWVFGTVFLFLYIYILSIAFKLAVKGEYIDKWLFVALGATFFHSLLSGVLITPVSLFFSSLLISVILKRTNDQTPDSKLSHFKISTNIKLLFLITPVFYIGSIYSEYLGYTGSKENDSKKMIQSVTINPYNSRTLYALSFYELGANRDTVQSLNYIDQFLTGYPYHIAGLLIKAERHYQLKEYRIALDTIETLLAFYPDFKKAKRLKQEILRKQ